MWKAIKPGDTLEIGCIVRMTSESYPVDSDALRYKVIKTELHYFEICPENVEHSLPLNGHHKIIRYTDIGYYLFIEVWEDPSLEPKLAAVAISYGN